jgi:hypothetical protein
MLIGPTSRYSKNSNSVHYFKEEKRSIIEDFKINELLEKNYEHLGMDLLK